MIDRRRKLVLSVLCIGSVVLLWRIHAIFQRYAPAGAVAAVPSPAEPVPDVAVPVVNAANAQDLSAMTEAQRRLAGQPWGRDPFDAAVFHPVVAQDRRDTAPSASAAPPAPRIRFTGVSKAGEKWLAAIDGQIVRVGDVVQEQYRVARITTSAVTLQAGGWAFEFSLGAREPGVRPWVERP